MKEVHDTVLRNYCIKKYHIDAWFDTPDLPFQLFQYAPGEIIGMCHPLNQYLIFMVEGSCKSSLALTSQETADNILYEGFQVFSVLALCSQSEDIFFQKVVEPVLTVELFLPPVGNQLKEDNRFLHFLIGQLTEKVREMVPYLLKYPLEELLLMYLQNGCPDHKITNVSETANLLHHSRSQLQRVLSKFTKEGIVTHPERGVYLLAEET